MCNLKIFSAALKGYEYLSGFVCIECNLTDSHPVMSTSANDRPLTRPFTHSPRWIAVSDSTISSAWQYGFSHDIITTSLIQLQEPVSNDGCSTDT